MSDVWTTEMKSACMKDAATVCQLTDEIKALQSDLRTLAKHTMYVNSLLQDSGIVDLSNDYQAAITLAQGILKGG